MSEPGSALRGKKTGLADAAGVPVKTLAVLALAVLLAHAWVLQSMSMSLSASENKVTRPFTTRVIEIKAAAPAGGDIAAANAATAPAKSTIKAPVARARKPVVPPSADAVPEAVSTAVSIPNSESNQAFPNVPYTELAINNEVTASPDPATAPAPAPAASSARPVAVAEAPPAAATLPTVQNTNAPTATTAYTVPGSVRLKYDVAGMRDKLNYTARGEFLWLQDGSTYEARLNVGAFLIGSRQFTSTGRMTADGLAPLRYADKSRTEVAAHFDRDRQRVTFSANTPEAPLQSGAQDRVSVFVQLGSMVAGEPAKYPAGTTVSLQIIGPRATEIWVVTVDGEEKLNLPGGELSALKMTRGISRDFDVKTEFWLAPALGYLPARIRFTQTNGDFLDQAWRATEAP